MTTLSCNGDLADARPSLAGQTVLVTGGTGLIGGRLVEKLVLEHGAHVRVLVRDFARASRIARFPVEMIRGTVTDLDVVKRAARGCSVVFSCAYANGGSGKHQWATNVGGADTIAEAVLAEEVPRLVHVSSLAVYGRTRRGVIDENEPRRKWSGMYARTKLESERRLLRQFQRDGLPVVILQPSIVYGPYANWSVLPLEWLATGRIVMVDEGKGLCNCVYVDDVVQALLLAAVQDDAVGQAFLISSEEAVSWKTFWQAHENMLGVRSTVSISAATCRRQAFWRSVTPRLLARILGRIGREIQVRERLRNSSALKMPGLRLLRARLLESAHPGGDCKKDVQWPDRIQIDQGTMQTRLDLSKAKSVLGYRPRFDFATGIELTAKWAEWANLLPRGKSVLERSGLAIEPATSGDDSEPETISGLASKGDGRV